MSRTDVLVDADWVQVDEDGQLAEAAHPDWSSELEQAGVRNVRRRSDGSQAWSH